MIVDFCDDGKDSDFECSDDKGNTYMVDTNNGVSTLLQWRYMSDGKRKKIVDFSDDSNDSDYDCSDEH